MKVNNFLKKEPRFLGIYASSFFKLMTVFVLLLSLTSILSTLAFIPREYMVGGVIVGCIVTYMILQNLDNKHRPDHLDKMLAFRFQPKTMTPTRSEFLPYVGIEKDILVNLDGSCSMFFRFSVPPQFSMTEALYEDLNRVLTNIINTLPKNYALARYDLISPRTSTLNHPPSDFVSATETRDQYYMRERRFIETESFLVLTHLAKKPGTASWLNHSFSRKVKDAVIAPSPSDLAMLRTAGERLVNTLTAALSAASSDQNWKSTSHVKALNEAQIVELIFHRMLNLSIAKPLPFSAEILNKKDEMIVGSKTATIFSINDDGYPDEVFPFNRVQYGASHLPVSMLNALQFKLAFEHVIVNVFYSKTKQEIFEKLDQKLNNASALMRGRSGSYNDVLYSKTNESVKDLRENSSRQVVGHHMSIIVVGDKNEPLAQTTALNEVRELLGKTGIQFNESLFSTCAKFHALLPGNASELPESERGLVPAEVACSFWNFEARYHEAKQGIRFIDRVSRKPMFIDFWTDKNLNNRNFTVVGETGSGKTFMVQSVIDQNLTLGYQVVVIDKVGNYKRLAESYGAKSAFIECSEQYPLGFNPFIVSKDDNNLWCPNADELELIVKTMFTALRLEDKKGSSNIEERALFILVAELFKSAKEQTEAITFDQFYQYLENMPTEQRKSLVKGKFDFDEFSVGMKTFCIGGKYGQILNATSNEDILNRPFVVFDNKNVENSDTLKVLMSYVSGLIIAHKLIHRENKEQPLIILFDEAWANLGSALGQYLIEYLYRCCRRFLGSVGIITQSIQDIEQSSLSHVISANAMTLFSFKPAEQDRKVYKSLMSLKDNQLNLLYSLQQAQGRGREVFLKTGDFANVYEVETSPYTRIALSSKVDDHAKIQRYYDESGNLDQAILSVVHDQELN